MYENQEGTKNNCKMGKMTRIIRFNLCQHWPIALSIIAYDGFVPSNVGPDFHYRANSIRISTAFVLFSRKQSCADFVDPRAMYL